MKKTIGIILLSIILVIALISLTGAFSFDIRISEDKVNALLENKLPSGEGKNYYWTVNDAKVAVAADNRIVLDAALLGNYQNHNAQATVKALTNFRFDQNGAVWLSGVQIDRIDDVHFYRSTVISENRVPDKIRTALNKIRDSDSFQKLQEELGEKAQEALMPGVKQSIALTLEKVLEYKPVYQLKGWKAWVARFASLKVTANLHDFIVTLDPIGGFFNLILGFSALLFAIIATITIHTSGLTHRE